MQQTARNNQWRGLTLKETWIFPTATNRMSWEPLLSAYTHFLFRANGFIFVPQRTNLCFQNLLSCFLYSVKNKRTPCVCGLFPGYLCINYTGTIKPNYVQVLRGLGESCSMRQDTPELLPGNTQLHGCVADAEKWRHVPKTCVRKLFLYWTQHPIPLSFTEVLVKTHQQVLSGVNAEFSFTDW